MNFGSGRLKLKHKLFLLAGTPLSTTFALTGYLIWSHVGIAKEHPIILLLVCCLAIAYIFISLAFIRKLGGGISVIENISQKLASGKFDVIASVNGLPETGNIGAAIKTIGEGVSLQTKFAEALKGDTGVLLESNSAGEEVLCAYAPLSIADVEWVILSTMKETEASQRIKNLREGNANF